jgi:hypothetical protein
MKNFSSDNPRFNISVIAIVYGMVAIFLGFTIVANKFADIPFSFFSSDPLSTFNAHPLTGIQSTLGVLIWVCTAGICLFTSAVLRNREATDLVFHFFLWSGIITLILTCDDLFLIHEDLAYRYLEIGQKTIFAIYVLLIGWYIFKFRKTIPHSDHLLFVLALIFLGLSEGVDMIEHYWNSPWSIFIEDGLKLFGIVSWSVYLIRECFRFVITS